MLLFQRVKILAQEKAGSVSALGKQLGKSQQVFNGYLNESRQNNLWPLLPQILELYPDVSRDWLFFGEGEMLAGSDSPKRQELAEENAALRADLELAREKLDAIEKDLREALKQNSRLINRFLLDGVGDKEGCAACENTQAAQR